MTPPQRPLNAPQILRLVTGYRYPDGWYPSVRFDVGGEWFCVRLSRVVDQTDDLAMDLAAATEERVRGLLARLVELAVYMPEAGGPLTAGEITSDAEAMAWQEN